MAELVKKKGLIILTARRLRRGEGCDGIYIMRHATSRLFELEKKSKTGYKSLGELGISAST